MDERPVSESLYAVLMRQGLRGKGAVTPEPHMNEKAGRSRNGAAPQVTLASREEIGLCHTDEPSSARQGRPVLCVVNDKCLRRANPMQGPRFVLRRHLALVWSQP